MDGSRDACKQCERSTQKERRHTRNGGQRMVILAWLAGGDDNPPRVNHELPIGGYE